jgi:PAS domain S-box-containing protein
MRVLYVEDDPMDADLTQRELRRKAPHFTLQIAHKQSEAMRYLEVQADQYDLLLTDLNLPDGGGFALLTYVREHGLPLAVVVITGAGNEETAVAALKAGADDYLVKPQGDYSHLAPTLESALQRYRTEVARRARPLRVLYAEQNQSDIEQVSGYFSKHAQHIHFEYARTVNELNRRLEQASDYDALLVDYQLHNLNALDVLRDVRQLRGLDLPIILVTSERNQEVAVQALRLGANDFVVKSSGYVYQLPGLLENAYHFAQMRREQAALIASEKRFRALIENSADGVLLLDGNGFVVYASPASQRILGGTPASYVGKQVASRAHPDDQEQTLTFWQQVLDAPGSPINMQIRIRHEDGHWLWMEATGVNSLNEAAVQGVVVNFRDITERKNAEAHIQRQLQKLRALRTVDMAIASSLDLRLTLAVLMDHLVAQLAVDAADVLLFRHSNQELEYGDGRGFGTQYVERVRLRVGEGLAGLAAAKRETVRVSNLMLPEHAATTPKWFRTENFITYIGTPLVAKNQVKGILEIYQRQSFEPDDEWLNFFETLAGQAAIAIDNAELFENLQQANEDLVKAYDSTLEGWVRALDLRDKETENHTQRVAEITLRLAGALGVSQEDLKQVRRGALLHDIGKIGIPDRILLKEGPLNEAEWNQVRMHPKYAYEWLSPIEYLRPALDIPYSHHEKWDGTGYPQGLKGEQIPLAARIFAVVDVWDALTNDRPYRRAWERNKVIDYIKFLSGSHFDSRIAGVFLKMVEEEELLTGEMDTQAPHSESNTASSAAR